MTVEVVGCRKLYNEEIHELYSLANIIGLLTSTDEMSRLCGHVERREMHRILMGTQGMR
jgi:hypothetical protein